MQRHAQNVTEATKSLQGCRARRVRRADEQKVIQNGNDGSGPEVALANPDQGVAEGLKNLRGARASHGRGAVSQEAAPPTETKTRRVSCGYRNQAKGVRDVRFGQERGVEIHEEFDGVINRTVFDGCVFTRNMSVQRRVTGIGQMVNNPILAGSLFRNQPQGKDVSDGGRRIEEWPG